MMKKLDSISGLFFLILGLSICIESYRVSLGDFHSPGPGFFPFLTGLAIAVLSFALLVQVAKTGPGEKVTFFEEQGQSCKLIMSIVSLLAYGFLLDHLGFILCTLVYIGFVARAVGGMKWQKAILLAVLSSFGSYIIFGFFLKADLPQGIWTF
jgi:hypothetical protein